VRDALPRRGVAEQGDVRRATGRLPRSILDVSASVQTGWLLTKSLIWPSYPDVMILDVSCGNHAWLTSARLWHCRGAGFLRPLLNSHCAVSETEEGQRTQCSRPPLSPELIHLPSGLKPGSHP